jgi:phosphoribosylglycinamide formyltransferase-1
VNEGVDEGEIIAQSHLEIIRPTTADELAKQVQQLEHRLYPNALKLAVENMAQT